MKIPYKMLNETFIGLCLIMSNIQHLINIVSIPIRYVFLYFSEYNYYLIERRENIVSLKTKLKPCICFKYDDDENPVGFIISYDPVTYSIRSITNISSHKYEDSVSIYTTPTIFKELFCVVDYEVCKEQEEAFKKKTEKNQKHEKIDKTNEVQMYSRHGDYRYLRYAENKIIIENVQFDLQQQELYNQIIASYTLRPNVVTFIWGGISVGKTYFSYILANKLEGSLCYTFRPTDPGDTFECLYRNVNPTKNKPLIVLLDEIDIMLEKIHYDKVEQHKKYPVSIYDKNTWNFFLDQFDYNVWRNVIVIMCSNRSIEEINKLDPSYLRDGRVHIKKHFV